jgi:hypothetical protein
VGSFKGSSLFLVGAAHTLENIKWNKNKKPKAFSAFKYPTHQNQVLWMMLYNHLKWCHTHQ